MDLSVFSLIVNVTIFISEVLEGLQSIDVWKSTGPDLISSNLSLSLSLCLVSPKTSVASHCLWAYPLLNGKHHLLRRYLNLGIHQLTIGYGLFPKYLKSMAISTRSF